MDESILEQMNWEICRIELSNTIKHLQECIKNLEKALKNIGELRDELV